MNRVPVPFVCPACKGHLLEQPAAYSCPSCARSYPVIAGIADFRLAADPWISLADDRAKGVRLQEATIDADFPTTVRTYWQLTPTTPPPVAARFIDHVLGAVPRTRQWLSAVVTPADAPAGPWLDLGCGTADIAAAAPPEQVVVGIDVAFRWLIAARKRLQASGRVVALVCCNAEHLPFPASSFSRVVSLGLLEHCADPAPVLQEAARVLQPHGQLAMRTVNRFSLLPEPHVGVWGVGFVPRRLADAYVQWRSGQRYEHHRPISRAEMRRAAHLAGLREVRVAAARLLAHDRARLGRLARLAPAYDRLSTLPVVGRGISLVAPMLEITARTA